MSTRRCPRCGPHSQGRERVAGIDEGNDSAHARASAKILFKRERGLEDSGP